MSSKTVTMKIDLSCCDDCVQRMKRLIRRFKGVETSSIDVKNGLVIVSGHIDHPDKIIDKIRKKGKPVTLFSVHYDDDLSDAESNTVESTPNSRPKDSNKNSGESNEDHKCKAHGGQSKVHEYSSEHFCIRDGDQNGEWDGISDRQCRCCHGERSHAEKPINKRVYFADAPDFYPKQDFDSVHYDYRHYPEMFGHYHGQIPQQQFQNCPMDFGTRFFSDDSPSGCWIM